LQKILAKKVTKLFAKRFCFHENENFAKKDSFHFFPHFAKMTKAFSFQPNYLVAEGVSLDDVEGGRGPAAVGPDEDLHVFVVVKVADNKAGLADANTQVVVGPVQADLQLG
jgi:hypothetical protein